MLRVALLSIALATGACDAAFGLDPVTLRDATSSVDTALPLDAAPPDAPLGPWGNPVPLAIAATADGEEDPAESPDGDELYFMLTSATSTTGADLYRSRRGTGDVWLPPEPLTLVNSGGFDAAPRVSADGLTLYFASDRPGGAGTIDVWASTRSSLGDEWQRPQLVALPDLNTAGIDRTLTPCRDGRYVFASDRTNTTSDLFELVGSTVVPIAVAGDPAFFEGAPFVTEDCLTVYYAANPGGDLDLFTITRPSLTAAWSAPERLPLSTTVPDSDPWVSRDGRRLRFSRDVTATNNFDLYEATR